MLELTNEEREAMIDTLEVMGRYPRKVYESYSNKRLVEEYDLVIGGL